jgi:hypothetical protein
MRQCKRCACQRSITSGTLFQDAKSPPSAWFGVVRDVLASSGCLPTSGEIGRAFDVARDTGWRLLQ